MNILVNAENTIGKDFASGLNKLKAICEKE
jgi:hypothetical protein